MITLENVSLTIGTFQLEQISLTLGPGEAVALMGRTGSGKTSLLEAICGLRPITAGRILCDGVDVTQWDPADRQIGYVPQDLALFPTYTVRGHLEFALRLRKLAKPAIRQRVDELAEWLGLTAHLSRPVQGLSGGEAQRVALGRALAFHPAVLLLDEPFSALDDQTRAELAELLRRMRTLTGVTTLHVTHHRADADAVADRIVVLDAGKLRPAG